MAGVNPNDAPPMYLGEIRQYEFEYKTAGDNTITTFSVECVPSGMLTFDTTTSTGLVGSTFATAAQTGCGSVIATAELTSGETIKMKVRFEVCDPTVSSDARDYE